MTECRATYWDGGKLRTCRQEYGHSGDHDDWTTKHYAAFWLVIIGAVGVVIWFIWSLIVWTLESDYANLLWTGIFIAFLIVEELVFRGRRKEND